MERRQTVEINTFTHINNKSLSKKKKRLNTSIGSLGSVEFSIQLAEFIPIKLYVIAKKGSQLLGKEIPFTLPLGGSQSRSRILAPSVIRINTQLKDSYMLSYNCHASKFSINHKVP